MQNGLWTNFTKDNNDEKTFNVPVCTVCTATVIGPLIQKTFGRAYKAGVNIAFGTDSGVSAHGDNAQEFALMVEAGMPAAEALKSATIAPAKMLGINDQSGSIEKGKLADIIAVEGNPLENIQVMEKVVFVMKDGATFKQ